MTRILAALRALMTTPAGDDGWAAVLDYVDGSSEPCTHAACSIRVYAPCRDCGSRYNVSLPCMCKG